MHAAFWETLLAFEAEAARLTRMQSMACSEMTGLRVQTQDTIAQSRALMLRIDEQLSHDGWCKKKPR